jgi:hypothetical protein
MDNETLKKLLMYQQKPNPFHAVSMGLQGKVYEPQGLGGSDIATKLLMADMERKQKLEDSISLEKEKNKIALEGIPSSFKPTKYSAGGVTYEDPDYESPQIKKQRIKDTNDLLETMRSHDDYSRNIDIALQSAKKIPAGFLGKLKIGAMKQFDPLNPTLTEWQNVKSLLTDAQLLYTAKTKGAISDAEMELFAMAAANDDMGSLPRVIPVLDRIKRKLTGELNAKKESYRINYGQLPEMVDTPQGVTAPGPSGKTVVRRSFNIPTEALNIRGYNDRP